DLGRGAADPAQRGPAPPRGDGDDKGGWETNAVRSAEFFFLQGKGYSMIQKTGVQPSALVVYPDSDGKPMAENTKQLRWIVVLFGNLCALFRDRPDVFVAADLFWYPVEGEPDIRAAPDVLLVFGRPKGDRG